jgi:anti-anti-sigma factor
MVTRDRDRLSTASRVSDNGQGEARGPAGDPGGPPELRVKAVERVAVVRFMGTEILFEGDLVRAVGDRLDRLVTVEGHTRLVLNFAGVRYASSEVLGRLAGLGSRLGPAGGWVRLCGLDPVLRDVLRVSHLDREFDVYRDETDALGLTLF